MYSFRCNLHLKSTFFVLFCATLPLWQAFFFFFSLQFLPVYKPSQEEKNDPNLYADNVQKLMAK